MRNRAKQNQPKMIQTWAASHQHGRMADGLDGVLEAWQRRCSNVSCEKLHLAQHRRKLRKKKKDSKKMFKIERPQEFSSQCLGIRCPTMQKTKGMTRRESKSEMSWTTKDLKNLNSTKSLHNHFTNVCFAGSLCPSLTLLHAYDMINKRWLITCHVLTAD